MEIDTTNRRSFLAAGAALSAALVAGRSDAQTANAPQVAQAAPTPGTAPCRRGA